MAASELNLPPGFELENTSGLPEGFTLEEVEQGGDLSFWQKAQFISPLTGLAAIDRVAREAVIGSVKAAAKEAFKVGRADKTLGEGLTPWTPNIPGIADVNLGEINGQQVTIPGIDTRLKARSQAASEAVDPAMRERVQERAQGKQWPVQQDQSWYNVDPSLLPEVIHKWATSVGDQTAVLIQQLEGKVVGAMAGGAAGLAVGQPAVGAKVGGVAGQVIVNVENETKGYMHDAEFWGISDKKIMEENARYYGLSAGLMEYAQNAVELAAARGTLKLGAKEVAKRGLVVRGLKELGINAGEGLTEVSQDGLERFFLKRAAGQMQAADPNFKMPDIPDTFAGWKRTFAQAVGTAAIMRGAGHAGKATMQNLYGQEKVKPEQVVENKLMREDQVTEFRPEPRLVPVIDTEEPVGNRQLQEEGEATLTEQEQATLDQLETELEPEEIKDEEHMIVGGGEKGVVQGDVTPNLYIGNVTPRAKKVWAELLSKARRKEGLLSTLEARKEKEETGTLGDDVSPRDIGPHKEGPFPTKRTKIKLSVDEARNLEESLTQAIDERLEQDKSFDPRELALLKATWGDVKELRSVLGLPTGQMPFKVIRGGKTKIAVMPNVSERIYTAIEGPGKKLLAQMSHSDLVTQGQAIAAAMKKAAVAAKHAFSVGNKEGQAKIREQVRELKRKARAIKLATTARKKMVKALIRKVSSQVDPYYRQAIQKIANRIDAKRRSPETQARLGALQQAEANDPQLAQQMAGHPLHERLQSVPANRMGTQQLQALLEERQRLEKLGKVKQKASVAHLALREQNFNRDATAALGEVPLRQRIAVGQDTDNATWFQKLWDKWRGFKGEVGFGTYRMDRMMEFLDGFKRGFFTHIWEKVKSDLHTSRERRSIRVREFVQAMKDMGIDGSKWMVSSLPFRKSDGTVHSMSPWQLIGAYIQSRHATGKGHLIQGNKFSEADLKLIVKIVENDPKMVAAHQWLVKRQQAQWRALTEKLRQIGVDPTQYQQVTEYLPLMIADLDLVQQDDVLQRFLGQFMPQELLPKGFLKERQEGAGQPIELDAMLLYMHSIDQVEHVMAMAPILKQLGSMVANGDFRKALNDRTYGKGADIWTQWLLDIGRDRVVREQMFYDRVIHYLQRNAVLYAIGWNIPSVLKQVPALSVGFGEDPRMVTFLIDNIMALSSPERLQEFRDQARERSSVLRHRNIEPELRAMWNKPHLQAMMKKQFGGRSIELDASATGWMRSTDDWLTTLVWKCRYDAVLSEGYNEEAAIRLADSTVQKTQQMASPEDLPHLFRGGTISSIINLFQNQGNQELNYWVHDIYGKATRGQLTPSQVAWRVMMAVILPIAVFNVVSHGGGSDEDEEDKQSFGTQMVGYMTGNLPLVGRVANVVVNGYGGGADMWAMPLEGIEQMVSGVGKGDWKTAVKGVAKASTLLPTKGLINSQAVRTVEGVLDLQSEETEDKRRLVWSKAMLGEKQQKKSERKGGIR